MVRAITLSAIVVLLVGSGAMAQINIQTQNWDFGLTNNIGLGGGAGNASTTQGIGTVIVQNIGINPDEGDPPAYTATAWQSVGVALFQTGGATTHGKVEAGLDQSLSVSGLGLISGTPFSAGQVQSIADGGGATLQYEGVQVEGTQKLEKGSGASAEVDGLNLTSFGMTQVGANTCVGGCQTSLILGGQYSALEGAAQGTGTVETGMNATVQQYQSANNPPAQTE